MINRQQINSYMDITLHSRALFSQYESTDSGCGVGLTAVVLLESRQRSKGCQGLSHRSTAYQFSGLPIDMGVPHSRVSMRPVSRCMPLSLVY